jgi:hypothetical protein
MGNGDRYYKRIHCCTRWTHRGYGCYSRVEKRSLEDRGKKGYALSRWLKRSREVNDRDEVAELPNVSRRKARPEVTPSNQPCALIMIKLVLVGRINPGKVFDLMLPLRQVAEAYRAMDERRAIKVLLRP